MISSSRFEISLSETVIPRSEASPRTQRPSSRSDIAESRRVAYCGSDGGGTSVTPWRAADCSSPESNSSWVISPSGASSTTATSPEGTLGLPIPWAIATTTNNTTRSAARTTATTIRLSLRTGHEVGSITALHYVL